MNAQLIRNGMISTSQAKIYLAQKRGYSQNEWYRAYHTLNYENYQEDSRKPFGSLITLNDCTLKSLHTKKFKAHQDIMVMLLPVIGGLYYRAPTKNEGFLQVEESYIFFIQKNKSYEVSNPYENELVNFLVIEMVSASYPVIGKTSFKIDRNKNNLCKLFTADKELIGTKSNLTICIGKFDGRVENIFEARHPSSNIFAFVIEGSFEVHNRLLEWRDGLAIWNTKTVEFEALSNDAIIFIFEMGINFSNNRY